MQPTVRRYPGARTHAGDGIRQGFVSIPHCNSTRRRRTSVVVNGTRLCNVTVTPCLHPNPPRKGPYRRSLYSCFVIFVLKLIARILNVLINIRASSRQHHCLSCCEKQLCAKFFSFYKHSFKSSQSLELKPEKLKL